MATRTKTGSDPATDTREPPDTPTYPVEACNANGPYPQDVAIRWQSYAGSANPPVSTAAFDIGIGGMHAWCALTGATPGDVYDVDWADGTAPASMTAYTDGTASVSHDYTAAGTYSVTVRDDSGTQVATSTLTATAP